MISVRQSLVFTALAAAIGAGAIAQTAPATPPAAAAPDSRGHAQGHGQGHRDSGEWQQRFERRMGELRQQLQISPAQEGAWTAFTEAMQPGQRMQRPDREAMAGMSTPQRIDTMRAMRAQRMARMDQRADATKTFYAALSPEQQKTFDELTARRLQKGGKHHGEHRGGRHGGPHEHRS